MLVFSTQAELKKKLNEFKINKQSIGFVPTMGALHLGHISLINYSKQQCNVTVCSIFVNPTQFNNSDDLAKYPKTPENDVKLLENAGCDILYMPSVEDIYPIKNTLQFKFGFLDTVLEGALRPGHFNGVGQVVSVLFDIVTPNKAYFGSKDYQQVMVVKHLVSQLNLDVEIIACPILRENDCLAMSSRNTRLNSEERIIASLVPKIMIEAKNILLSEGIGASKNFVNAITSKISYMKLDYFEVCDANNLENLISYKTAIPTVILIAVFVGNVRLIDNLVID